MEASSLWAGIKTVNSCLSNLSESWDGEDIMLIGSEIRELRLSVRVENKPNLPPYTSAYAITPFMCIKAKILKTIIQKNIRLRNI